MMMTRRDLLTRCGAGFGMLGLAGTLQGAGALSLTHTAAKAKRVIFLFMNGGPSHVDTFDPKPALKTHEGQLPSGTLYRAAKAGFVPSPFSFKRCGQGGIDISEILPNLQRCADDLCVLRSMHTDIPNHEPGLLIMNSGHLQPTRPSLGSWVSYGLGSLNHNLPSFVVLAPRKPVVGPQLWSSSFLPGAHQGMSVDTNDMKVDKLVANLKHPNLDGAGQRRQLDLVNELNRLHMEQRPEDAALEAQVRAMETAFNMQREASDAFDISKEPASLRASYGESNFGQSCLLARRLVERGVRFVQVYYLTKGNNQPWDTHSNNDVRQRELCADSDRATAALLLDLKQRGLLEDTLVIWSGEFGRTPFAEKAKNGKNGRDHHHTGFTTVLAGGGVKGGLAYGSTDEVGMNAVDKRIHVHDLHATILHLLGIDHEKLTYRYSGREFRLTDVHGHVVRDIIA
jgi:hypothetical protein